MNLAVGGEEGGGIARAKGNRERHVAHKDGAVVRDRGWGLEEAVDLEADF